MESKLNSFEDVQQFFDQCVSFWQRQGDDIDVARCKAFWWDLVEVSNKFDNWTSAKKDFSAHMCGYKPGDIVPDEALIRSGNCPPASEHKSGKHNCPLHDDRLYTVQFVREANNMIDHINFNCWARNAQDAKRIAKETWEARHRSKVPHMFHLEAHRAFTQNTEDLRVTDWLKRDIIGWDTMWRFIRTSSISRRRN